MDVYHISFAHGHIRVHIYIYIRTFKQMPPTFAQPGTRKLSQPNTDKQTRQNATGTYIHTQKTHYDNMKKNIMTKRHMLYTYTCTIASIPSPSPSPPPSSTSDSKHRTNLHKTGLEAPSFPTKETANSPQSTLLQNHKAKQTHPSGRGL